MDPVSRAQISKGGLYPAINPKPFPGFSYTTLAVVQDFYLKPKTYNLRINLRLYYSSDESPFPELKSLAGVGVKAVLTITPPGMLALSSKTDRDLRKIHTDEIIAILKGVPSGVGIKAGSVTVGGRSSVDNDLYYTAYGISVVSLTFDKHGYTDQRLTIIIRIAINYFSGSFDSAPLVKGDRIWLKRPTSLSAAVMGTNPYHESSDAATAVVHAGLLWPGRSQLLVTVTDRKRVSSFAGSTANGVTSVATAGWGISL